jgi:hypothetical protein
VDSSGNVGQYTSLALDGSGYPHISYYFTNHDLKYAYQDSSGWHPETIDDAIYGGSYTSLLWMAALWTLLDDRTLAILKTIPTMT